MKRVAKLLLVPAGDIVKGRAYVACLHGNTDYHNRTHVIASESEDDHDKENDCFTCRFENGNTYPFMRNELFKFVAEYEVTAITDPTKIVGTNKIDVSCADYEHIITNPIGRVSYIEINIDFDNNVARLLTKQCTYTFEEMVKVLESMKFNDAMDNRIDQKIKELREQYKSC